MLPPNNAKAGRRNLLDRAIRAHMPHRGYPRIQYQELISVIRSNSDLLTPQAIKCGRGERSIDRMMFAFAKMSFRWQSWLRPIYTWTPVDGSPRTQFDSLVLHLFAKYDVPGFLTQCWFESSSSINLMIALGRGKSIRSCRLPVRINKPMIRHFMLAPNDLTVFQATRWAQVRGLGGSETLARDVLATRLARPQPDEEFWLTFLEFLVKNQNGQVPSGVKCSLSRDEVFEMAEFCHSHKFAPVSQLVGYRVHNDVPLQPNFSLDGRSIRWLRRRMANWKNEVELPARSAVFIDQDSAMFWDGCAINCFSFSDGVTEWTVEQILSSHMLRVEGSMMRHCAGMYARRCKAGQTSVWTMMAAREGVRKRILTIEVWPDSRIVVQAKGKRNSSPTPIAATMLRRWMRQEGLKWFDNQ